MWLLGAPRVHSRGAATAGLEIPGKMSLVSKSAELCNLLDLQGFIAQQIFGLLQSRAEKVIFWRGGKEAAVIDIKLAFFQVGLSAEPLDIPVFFALGEHLKAQALKQGIEMPGLFLLRSLLGHAASNGEEQQSDQGMDGFLPVGQAGEILLLQTGDKVVDLHGIFRIKNGIFRQGKEPGGIFIGRKVKIVVPESMDSLIMLGHAGSIEDAGILLCDYNFVVMIDFHGGLKLEKEIIPAS